MAVKELIINNWQQGMANSPHEGFGWFKNTLVDAVPGTAMVQFAPEQLNKTGSSTFTADPATDICTGASLGSALVTGVAVQLTTTGTLPAGLATSTNYFLIQVTSTTFKLATTKANADAGTAVNITDAGTGTHTVTILAMGTVRSSCKDRNGLIYMVDSNGRVWYYDNSIVVLMPGNTLSNASGKGIVAFTNSDASATYLFVFRNGSVDVVPITNEAARETPVWTNAWQSLNTSSSTSNSHHAIVGQDNIIYFCDGRYVGSIRELTTFDPASGATYTYNNQALTLPNGEIASWLEELGINLLIAGQTYNKIYPWDRIAISFFLPLIVAEPGVYRLKNINNIVYILAGLKGNVYQTNGATVQLYKRIPESIIGNGSSNNISEWGGIASRAGDLVFGLASVNNSSASGIWRISKDGILTMDQIPSTGAKNVTTILDSEADFYYFGYNGGFDGTSTTRYGNLEAVIQTPVYRVGIKSDPATFQELEIQLANKISSGQVRVSYRTATSDSFTTLSTFTMDNTNTSFTADIGLINIENLQLQIEMNGTGSNSSALQLMEVRLLK